MCARWRAGKQIEIKNGARSKSTDGEEARVRRENVPAVFEEKGQSE